MNISTITQEKNEFFFVPYLTDAGYPIWWGNCPKIIYTFLESYDLSGKIVIPFCTSGSSGISTSEATIKGITKATVENGKRFNSNASSQEVKNWVDSKK